MQLFIQNLENIVEADDWIDCKRNQISPKATPFSLDIHQNDLFFARAFEGDFILVGKCSHKLGDARICH